MFTIVLLVNYIGLTFAYLCPKDDFSQHFESAQGILERNDTVNFNKTVKLMYDALKHCEFEEKIRVPALKHCRGHCHLQPRCYAFNVSSDPFGCQFCLDFGISGDEPTRQDLSRVYFKSESIKDNCMNISCENNGNCSSTPTGFTCECAQGSKGRFCNTNIDECGSSPCVEGNCTDSVNGYTCACVLGFTGTNCQNIDECMSSPCVEGTCIDRADGYTCACVTGFTGTNCQADIDECVSSPCNEGTCTDNINGYTCTCVTGFTGTYCETNINECASSPCVEGICLDTIDGYTCVIVPDTTIRPISIVGQPAYTSSPHPEYVDYGPEKAVDGNNNTIITNNGCFHSAKKEPLWWGVNFGRDMYVSRVKITNRGEACCRDRLRGFSAYVSSDTVDPVNSPDKQLCAEMPGIYRDIHVNFPCDSSIFGRFLSLSFDFVDQVVNFCEVEVAGFYEEDLLDLLN